MLFYVVWLAVTSWVLVKSGPLVTSDSCFFLGQKDNMKTGHMMQQAELSYTKPSVALVVDSFD